MTHNARSGVAHFAVADDRECLSLIRELLSFLPSNNLDDAPRARRRLIPPIARTTALDRLVPELPNQPYDMLDLIHSVADDGYFLEVHRHFATNIIVGFARLDGRSGRHRREPAGPPCGDARHRRVGEGRAIRAVLRRLQHSARHVRGRAGIPAGNGAGVRRDHQARSEAALRVRRSDRAEGDASSRARHTAAPTASCRASTFAPTSTSRGRRPRSR